MVAEKGPWAYGLNNGIVVVVVFVVAVVVVVVAAAVQIIIVHFKALKLLAEGKDGLALAEVIFVVVVV